MTETLVKEAPCSLRSLTNDIGFGRICLPDIQRTFVWAIAKVRDLFDSMYRGYPVGYLLLWQGSTFSDLLEPSAISNKKSLERHHLFPKHYVHKVGVKALRDTHQIANYALVEWDDNIAISDIPPEEYWPKYAASISGEELNDMMHWHTLPEGWQEMDYQSFLVARRPMIAQVIKQGYLRLVGEGAELAQ